LAGVPAPPDPTRPANEPIGVVIADDHAGVRRSLRLLLDGEEGVAVLAEAGDLEATSRALATHHPRVLVLDLWSTDGNARATVRDLRKRAPGTQIVAVTMNDSPPFARALLEAGAAAFVLKDLADSDLPRAIRVAAGGGEYVSPRISERLN
jgi:two-component system response regulator NreC